MAIDLLQIQPHQVSRDLSGYITYIYGAPKVGKTSLAAQTKDSLLIAAEKGYNAIAGIIAQDVTSWSEMRQVYKELKKDEVKARFKVLIVDTIDLLAKYCTKYICSQQGIAELSDLPYGKAYSLMRSEFEDIFNNLAQMGYAVIFISHAQDATFTRPDGSEYTKIIPSLGPAKVNAIIENMADIYGYAHIVRDAEGKSQRVLTLRSSDDSIACGSRFRYMQEEIPLTYDALVEALNRAIDAEAENDPSLVTNNPIAVNKKELDFDKLKNDFNKLVKQIQEASGNDFGNIWAPKIVNITNKILGKGKRISDLTPDQVELLEICYNELVEQVGNGL